MVDNEPRPNFKQNCGWLRADKEAEEQSLLKIKLFFNRAMSVNLLHRLITG